MNAHTPILTPLALENIDVLHALALNEFPSRAALAQYLGRDPSNVGKTLKSLHAADLIDGPTWSAQPTEAGKAAIEAMARAEGRGAAAQATPAGDPAGVLVAHERIIPDGLNPRKHFDEAELAELADSIARDDLLENLVIRPAETDAQGGGPFHRLVAGERRWRAVKLLIADGRWPKDKGVPCKIVDIDDATHRRIALVENLQRKDLRPIDEAMALQELMELNQVGTAEIAQDIGFTQRFVQQRLQLLKLPAIQQVAVNAGKMTIEDARREVAKLTIEEEARLAKILEPAQLLAMAEVFDATHTRGVTLEGYYGDTPTAVGYRALEEGELLSALVQRGFLQTLAGWRGDARRFVSVASWNFDEKDLEAQLPGWKSKDRARVLQNLRRNVVGVEEANRLWDLAQYATWGLNPEFSETPDPSLEAEAEEWLAAAELQSAARFHRETERLQREEEAQAARAAGLERIDRENGQWGRDMLAAVRDLEVAAPTLDHAGFTGAFQGLMSRFGIAGPYALHAVKDGQDCEVRDGEGIDTRATAYALEARRRLLIIGFNYASGLPAYSGPDLDLAWKRPAEVTSEEGTTRAQFIDLLAEILLDSDPRLAANDWDGDDEDEANRVLAARFAGAGLDAYLAAEGVKFGDPEHHWGEAGAAGQAERILLTGQGQEGEGWTPPAEADDHDLPDFVKALATGDAKPIGEVEP